MASADETPPAASVAIVSMSVDRLVSAGELLASSYAEYPAWRYVFPDPRQCRVLRAVRFRGGERRAAAASWRSNAVGPAATGQDHGAIQRRPRYRRARCRLPGLSSQFGSICCRAAGRALALGRGLVVR
jgi:hypothetical protein